MFLSSIALRRQCSPGGRPRPGKCTDKAQSCQITSLYLNLTSAARPMLLSRILSGGPSTNPIHRVCLRWFGELASAHMTAIQATRRLLPNCGEWLPVRKICSGQRAQLAVSSSPLNALAVWESGSAGLCPSWRAPAILQSCAFGAFIPLRYSQSLSASCQNVPFLSRSFSRESTVLSVKKEGSGDVESVGVVEVAGVSMEAGQETTGTLDESDSTDDEEDSDESWEEGIAPLDEVEIPLDGEGEDGWEYESEEAGPIEIGDGGDGGGIKVGTKFWGRKALEYAQEVLSYPEFAGKFKLYAFRAYDALEIVKLRLDKLEDTYGSPTMEEIQSFARAYNLQLDEAAERKELPIIETEVGSPGAERVVQVPADLGRFQDLPMVVSFMAEKEVEEKKERKGGKAKSATLDSPSGSLGSGEQATAEAPRETEANGLGPSGVETLQASMVDPSLAHVKEDQLDPGTQAEPKLIEHEEVLALESYDLETQMTVWKLADTRANRASGKGRGLNRKQRDRRWHLPFSSLKVVRLYLEI